MTQVLTFLVVGAAVGSAALFLACCMTSGRKREAWEDDEQASTLAADNRARFVASSKSAVSVPH